MSTTSMKKRTNACPTTLNYLRNTPAYVYTGGYMKQAAQSTLSVESIYAF